MASRMSASLCLLLAVMGAASPAGSASAVLFPQAGSAFPVSFAPIPWGGVAGSRFSGGPLLEASLAMLASSDVGENGVWSGLGVCQGVGPKNCSAALEWPAASPGAEASESATWRTEDESTWLASALTWSNFSASVAAYSTELAAYSASLAEHSVTWNTHAESWVSSASDWTNYAESLGVHAQDLSAYSASLLKYAADVAAYYEGSEEWAVYARDLEAHADSLEEYSCQVAEYAQSLFQNSSVWEDYGGKWVTYTSDWTVYADYLASEAHRWSMHAANWTSSTVALAASIAQGSWDAAQLAEFAAACDALSDDWVAFSARLEAERHVFNTYSSDFVSYSADWDTFSTEWLPRAAEVAADFTEGFKQVQPTPPLADVAEA